MKDYASRKICCEESSLWPSAQNSRPIRCGLSSAPTGGVSKFHVIRATADQRHSIEERPARWKFKPYHQMGVQSRVETGLVFEFKPGRKVSGGLCGRFLGSNHIHERRAGSL